MSNPTVDPADPLPVQQRDPRTLPPNANRALFLADLLDEFVAIVQDTDPDGEFDEPGADYPTSADLHVIAQRLRNLADLWDRG